MIEDKIWKELSNKNIQAFEYIYETYYLDLVRYGLKICHDIDLVKDCIHDMILQMYERKSSFQEGKSLKPYLLVTLRNKLYDQLKSSKSEEWNDALALQLTAPNIIEWKIGEEAINQETQKVLQVISSLPPKQREVIHLRFYENMALSEIAEIMQIHYQSVQNLLQRALKSLSENLVIQEVKKRGTLFVHFLFFGKIRPFLYKISRLKTAEWIPVVGILVSFIATYQ